MQAGFDCAHCGSWNDTEIDPSQGEYQVYTEDCQSCCSPNELRAQWYKDENEFFIESKMDQ